MTCLQNPAFTGTLAAGQAAGNFEEVVRIARAAIGVARSTGNNTLIPEIDRRLDSFLTGKPYLEEPRE